MAVALAPLIFAIVTWNHGIPSTFMQLVRQLSFPVVAVECAVIFCATRGGMTLPWIYSAIPKWCHVSILILAVQSIIVATFFSAEPQVASAHAIILMVHLFFGFACAYLVSSAPVAASGDWRMIGACSAFLTALVLLFALTVPDPKTFDWLYFGLGVVNVRQLGFYSLVGCCAAVGIAVQSASRKQLVRWSLIASVSLALSVWSGTRGSLLAIVLSMTACAALALPYAGRMAKVGAISFAAALVLGNLYVPDSPYYGLVRVVDSVVEDETTEETRVAMWMEVPALLAERPLFGHGLGQYRFVAREARQNYNHPHNALAQFLVQWGLVGTALAIALGAALYLKALQRFRSDPADRMPPFLIVNGIMCMALYEGALFHPFPLMSLAFCYAWVLRPRQANDAVRRDISEASPAASLRERTA